MFPDEERQIADIGESEVFLQRGAQTGKSRHAHSFALESAEPVILRSKLFEPRVRRRENELSARLHEQRKEFQQQRWVTQAIDQICREYDVERAEILTQGHGVADLKRYALRLNVHGPSRDELRRHRAFIRSPVENFALRTDRLVRFDQWPRGLNPRQGPPLTREIECG